MWCCRMFICRRRRRKHNRSRGGVLLAQLWHLRQRASAGCQETGGTSGLGVEECKVEN